MTKIFIISAGRPNAVDDMNYQLDGLAAEVTWVVPENEIPDYEYSGAANVVPDGGSLCKARNVALDMAFADWTDCLQLSDDLKGLKYYDLGKTLPLTVSAAVDIMQKELARTGAMLAGVAPTDNVFFSDGRVKESAFIVGDMMLVRPCDLRFAEGLRLKEDYDYTLQHLSTYGKVCRVDAILASFAHRTNAGGACNVRTPEEEQRAIRFLKSKWGEHIQDNPRRPNEVMLRWRP